MADWDAIVLGLGGVGSAAIRHLAARQLRVLGIEQYSPAHEHGSSHGKTRIIRQAYFEHPSYVPLLCRAYVLWDQLEQDSGQSLFVRCGLVEMGPADGVVIPGVLASAALHDLPVEQLTPGDITKRWPGLVGDTDWQAVIETNAGFLRVEDSVRAHLQMAQRDGADCRFGVAADCWRCDGSGVTVTTNDGVHRAARLVLAGGPWSGQLLASLDVPLQILRKHLYWWETEQPGFSVDEGFPCFFHETATGFFYGFPSIDSLGVKVARHCGGQPLTHPDPSPIEVALDAEDLSLVHECVGRYLPGVSSRLTARAGCYYTTTPDQHFVIDRHPAHPQVTLIAGLSGHGFKFTSALGELACQLSLGERLDVDLSLFRIDRFGSRMLG